MKRILIFSGTTEGRRLTEILANAGVPSAVCVATEYGSEVMDPLSGIELYQGRMDLNAMENFMRQEDFLAVVDATHPFATEVSRNLKMSASMARIPYLRLKRETGQNAEGRENSPFLQCYFGTNESCAKALLSTEGNILLTTGSKELLTYCKEASLKERLYVRVLPSEESIAVCRAAGLKGKQIIAMQGPFSEEMNLALIRQYEICHLVTKETGTTGGFPEKVSAAKQAGIRVHVIGNPEKQDGLSFQEVCDRLSSLTGISLSPNIHLHISLIGIGMGDSGTRTQLAEKRIQEADYLFGAKRLLCGIKEQYTNKKQTAAYPYYTAKDILPVLTDILKEKEMQCYCGKNIQAAVLFSGDTGFYSGSWNLYKELEEWKKGQEADISIQVLPGISSVSYFAAACKISWQDAVIRSIHGKGERKNWEAEVLSDIRYHEKLFLLVSGVSDVREVGRILVENHLSGCRIFVGFQLSYPEETVTEYNPVQCTKLKEEGLYILAVLNPHCEQKYLAPARPDEAFVRGKVPMTKETVRKLAVCTLKLTEHAIVYDIGSGTGSVAMEIAERSETIQVYALEQKDEGVELIRQNREKFALPNVHIVKGQAPECFENLPAPTHAFIGGSGGRLEEILRKLYEKNRNMRIVMTAVTLETMGKIAAIRKYMPIKEEEILHLQVSKSRFAGSSHLMQAENPIYICSFDFSGE